MKFANKLSLVRPSFIILFAIFLNMYQATNTPNTSDKIGTSGFAQTRPIISTLSIQQMERLYVKFVQQNEQTYDQICTLSEEKKIALCNLIFLQINYYKNLDVKLNKTAFYVGRKTCETKHVRLNSQSHVSYDRIQQQMYHCYARHNPIRTSFVQDDYYDKFYISAGVSTDSVTVYVHKFDAVTDWYNLYNYVENINFSQIQDMSIRMKDATKEIKLNNIITSNTKQDQLEYIYFRENTKNKPDPVCELEISDKILLCRMILDQYLYKHRFWITINKEDFDTVSPICKNNVLKIRFSKFKRYYNFTQEMYPCFAKSRLGFGITNKYKYYLYISSGTRRNSLFIYYGILGETSSNGKENFYLFEMLENVYFKDTIKNNSINELVSNVDEKKKEKSPKQLPEQQGNLLKKKPSDSTEAKRKAKEKSRILWEKFDEIQSQLNNRRDYELINILKKRRFSKDMKLKTDQLKLIVEKDNDVQTKSKYVTEADKKNVNLEFKHEEKPDKILDEEKDIKDQNNQDQQKNKKETKKKKK